MSDEHTKVSLESLSQKLDNVLAILEELRAKKPTKAKGKAKVEPLTAEEAIKHQECFSGLFERWLNGDEIAVQSELEEMDTETVRKFADANNLNVTSKSSKTKCLQLIAARFREKRQLTRDPLSRDSSK